MTKRNGNACERKLLKGNRSLLKNNFCQLGEVVARSAGNWVKKAGVSSSYPLHAYYSVSSIMLTPGLTACCTQVIKAFGMETEGTSSLRKKTRKQ